MKGEASGLSRRALLAGLAAAAASIATSGGASAMGRTKIGGRLALSIPWAIDTLDPHDGLDAVAALFASAVFDTLYATTEAGAIHPALASAMPTRDGGGATVKLRPGLRTAAGKPLDGRDVVASLQRARARGAASLLAPLGDVRVTPHDPLGVVFARADAALCARVLASPLTAMVPRTFDPRAPDGTGAFSARFVRGGLELSRNEQAARGAAWLERVEVRSSADLRATLRAFEAGGDELGWLGAGLFGRRADSSSFDFGAAAIIALVVGEGLSGHARPGGAQALCDGIPRDRLAHLGLGTLPPGEPPARWTAGPVDLCVEADAPYLVEIGNAVASSLSQPDHRVSQVLMARRDVLARSRRDALGLLVVRPLVPGGEGVRLALAQLTDPAAARDLAARLGPPRPGSGVGSGRDATGTLRAGVLGELRAAGAIVRGISLARQPGGGWDLGASHTSRR